MNGQRATSDDQERAAVKYWRKGHVSVATIAIYLQWVRRFRSYCSRHSLVENEQLTAAGVRRFVQSYSGPRLKGRKSAQGTRDAARNSLHAWACATRAMGTALPPWHDKHRPAPLPPLIDQYCHYRRAHCGVSDRTLVRDIETARGFLEQLRRGRKRIGLATLSDVDAFVQRLASRISKRTVADTCSSLRAFLRFLQIAGKLPSDLASGVIAPRYRADERPPRNLPWADVQKILRSISRSEPPGKRDFAILLLLATYGVGAAEVLALRLDDLSWRTDTVTFRRPKTHVLIELPLLPQSPRR